MRISSILARISQRVQHLLSIKIIHSFFWVFLGNGGQQGIRLIGNLILTRILYPELFGIMALATAVMVGLGQISDIGLRPGVIKSNRTEDPEFMGTAWTLQILKTTVIFLFALIIAYPIANMYKEPVLAPIIMLFGLSIFVKGFRSIALLVYDKRLELKQQIKMDLITQTSGLLVMIVWAWIHPSIWALVGGQFVTIFLDVYLSYRMFTGHTSRFTWEKTSVSQLFGFGKWIFISSTISYITIHGDRLIMGKFLTMEELGKYSVAVAWASIIMMLSGSLSNRVLMPYFKMALDDNSNFGKIHRVRNLLNSAFVGVCICLALFGDHLISLLYDDRYSSAGWMLQILALGQVGRSLSGTLIPFMLATGDSFSQMKFSAASAVLLVSFITFGGYFAGGPGVVIAYGLSTLVAHPIMIAYACGNGFNCILEDMGFMLLALFTCLLGWWLMGSPILEEVLFLVDQYSQAA